MIDMAARLAELAGKVIHGVRRVHYEFDDALDTANGAIELSFDLGGAVLFDSGPDGESLCMFDSAWIDPFEGRLDEVNLDYIRTSGKWSAVDVTHDLPYRSLIGRPIEEVTTLTSRGKVIGLVLSVGGHTLVVEPSASLPGQIEIETT
jgi:hypothetical protein